MIRHTSKVRINRSMHEVFAFLQVPANYARWQVVMESIEATHGMTEGSIVTYTRSSELGERLTASIRITKNNGRDYMESVSVGGVFDSQVSFALAPLGPAQTLMEVSIWSRSNQVLPAQAEAALQYMTDSRTIADNKRLKQVLEGAKEEKTRPGPGPR